MIDGTAFESLPVRIDSTDWLDNEVPAVADMEPETLSVNAGERELSLDPEFDLTN